MRRRKIIVGVIILLLAFCVPLLSALIAAPGSQAAPPCDEETEIEVVITSEQQPLPDGEQPITYGAGCDFRWYDKEVWSEKAEYAPTEDFILKVRFANYGATSDYTVYFYLYNPGGSLVESASATGTLNPSKYVTWTFTPARCGSTWEVGDWQFCSDVTPVLCDPLTTKCCTFKVVDGELGEPDIRLDKTHLDFEFTLGASGSIGSSTPASEAATYDNPCPDCNACSAGSSCANCGQTPQGEQGARGQATASEESQLEAIREAIEEKGAQWQADITSVSRLSLEEKRRLCGIRLGPTPDSIETVTASPDVALPATFDWRDKDGIDWMTSVKNQICGTCWIFGTLGSLEAVINIVNNDPHIDMDLSEQMLLSCAPNITPTCGGGYPEDAYEYLAEHGGTPDEACFPYQCPAAGCPGATGVPCDACPDWEQKAWTITSYASVSPDTTEAYKAALVEYGPLGVAMRAPDDFFYYTGGIYEPVLESAEWRETFPYGQANHWVALVGYDDAGGYWIVKNSWCAGWGEEGYGKILYGDIEKYGRDFAITSVDGPNNCKAVTAHNDGNADLEVTDVAIGYEDGEPQGWLDAERKSFTLTSLHSEGITVWADTAGLSADTYHGWLDIYSNDPDESPLRVTVTLQVGNQPPTAYIDSITPDPATQGVDTVHFEGHGTDPDGSVVAYNWRSSIDGQLSTSSSFDKPASELSPGTHTIYFKVQDDDGAWSEEVTEDLTIIQLPDIRTPINDIDFGEVPVGNSVDKTTTIYNDGGGTLTIYSVTRVSGDPDFTYIGPPIPFDIGGGGSQDITIRFAPSSADSKVATFNVNSNDPDEPDVQFIALGNYVPPPWDVNCDGRVNEEDMMLVYDHFGETGSPGWIPEDVTQGGTIDVLDMILIGQHWTE